MFLGLFVQVHQARILCFTRDSQKRARRTGLIWRNEILFLAMIHDFCAMEELRCSSLVDHDKYKKDRGIRNSFMLSVPLILLKAY